MSTLGKAVIEFSADTAKFTGDVGRAAAVFDKSMGQMERGIQNIRNTIAGLVGIGGLAALAKQSIDAGEELNKLSQKAGMSVQTLSELKFGAGLADVSVQGLSIGLKEFNKSIVEAADKTSKSGQIFSALGVDLTRGPEAALKQVATRFAEMQDGAEKSTLAVEIFGKAGADMIPWLNQGAEGLARAAEQARALGLTMTKEQAENFERFNDNMKTLGSLSEVVGTSLANRLVPGINSLTQNLITAAEKGNLFWQVMIEGAKTMLALNSALTPSWMPQGKASEALTEALFNWDEQQRSMRTGPNVWPGAGGGAQGGTSGGANPEALACALSGGKWNGKKCVRASAGGSAGAGGKSPGLTPEQVMRAQMDGQEELNRSYREVLEYVSKTAEARVQIAESIRDELDPTRELVRQQEQAQRLADEGLLTQAEANRIYEERQQKIYELSSTYSVLGREVKKNDDFARDLGLTFTSAFESAIVKGQSLRDTLRGLAQDVLQIATRKLITEPIGNNISAIFSGSSSGGGSGIFDFFTSMFKAEGGPVTGGMPYIVGERGPELFVPGGSGGIVPNHAMGGMGGMTVTQQISVGGNVTESDIPRILAAAKQGAVQAYNEMQARGRMRMA